ncbi:MAG TPA: Ig-like domain-containing protein [Thermoanaerobaculia bacterium]
MSHRFPKLSAVLAVLAIPVGVALWAQGPPDTDPPVIQILESGSALVDGRLFNRAANPVVQVTDASAVTVDATLDGAAFTSGSAVAGEGTHLLSVSATDAAGNTASLVVGFGIDTAPPVFGSVQPADQAVVAAAQATLQGQVTGAVSVTVDGQAATLVGEDFTAGPYTLAEGLKTWTIVATDAAGNTAQRTHRITRDSQAPTVAISQPTAGIVLKDASVDVVGSASDPRLTGVTVNGIATTRTGTSWVAKQVPLTEGTNTLTARAEDQAGNAAEAARTVVRDSQAPSLAVTDPAPGTVVPGASITLRGTASDPHLDRVEIGGVRAQLANGSWSLLVGLKEGVNDFTVKAFDKVSNAAEATVSVTRDSEAPAVRITQPVDGAHLKTQTVTVSGTVEQEAGITVTVNGVAATVAAGAFTAEGVALVEGQNTLIARVKDSLGNQGTHTRIVTRDTVAPNLESADPASGALALPAGSVFRLTFSEEIADPAAGSWRLETGAGQAIAATAQRYGDVLIVRPSVPLPSSSQVRLVLTAALTDLAGNALAPQTLTFLTVDTTAPAAPAFSPAPAGTVCAPSLTLTGTAEAGAVVRIEGGAAAAETRAGEAGAFSVAVQLTPGGLNRLRATATDSGGNVSPATTVEVVQDCGAPRVVSAERQGDLFRIVFSEKVRASSLSGAVTLAGPSGPVAGSVSLAADGVTATFDPAGALPAGALRLEVSTAVLDTAGNPMAFPWSQVFGAQGGSGFLLGTVIDNATGRPLAGARVLVWATNGTTLPEPRPEQVTGADGRFRLPVPAGTHDLTIARPGYTPSFRIVTTGAGQGTDVFDPRLTPAAKAAVGALGGTISAAVTPLDEQGLPFLLPYGWSPRGAVWLDLDGAALPAESTLNLPVDAPNGSSLTLVYLDLASLQWRVAGSDQVADGRVEIALPAGTTDGAWAAVQADAGALAPPAPVNGAALSAAARPAGDEPTGATLTFNPEVVLPSQSSLATAVYTLSEDAASGLPLTLLIEEELTLLDNSVRRQTPYQADVILYHAPDGTPRSRFRLSPSEAAQELPLKLGAEDVTLRTYGGEAVAGNVVGPEGGTVTGDQGDRIDLPAGAVTGPTAIVLTRKTAADLGVALPSGVELAGVVDVDLGGGRLLVPAALSLALSPAPAAGEKGLLLHVIELESGRAFRAVAALQATANGWTTAAIDPLDLAWPGVRDEGLYAFVRLTAAFGYLRGTVSDVGGAPLAGAIIRSPSAGWVQISNADGTYVLPAPVAAVVAATAENRLTGNLGTGSAEIAAADARVDLDLVLQPVGPRVVQTTPADEAVDVPQGIEPTVRFSEPVDPASVEGAIQLLSEGQPVTVDLEVQGTLVRVKPRSTLLPAAAHELRITSGVKDLQGISLEAPVAVQFTTLRVLLTNDIDLTRIFLVAPDANGEARVLGRPGAVPAGALVFVENRTALVDTPTVTAGQDGGFDVDIEATLSHTLILHVLIPGSNEIVVRLTPFRTPDLKGAYVDEKASTFTTGEGLTVDVPAGAFAGPTIVRAAPRTVATSPVLARDAFAPVAAFTLDFGGAEAVKPLQISVPLPGGSPTPVGGFYLLNRAVEALGDRYWMMHDLMRLDASGRLTTTEEPAAAAAPLALAKKAGPQVVTAASIVPQHKQFVPGAAFPGQYQIEAPLIPLGFTIFPVFDMNSQVGVWNLGLEGIFTSMNAKIAQLLSYDGILVPTRIGQAVVIEVRGLASGDLLFSGTFDPPTGEDPLVLPPDVYGDTLPPFPAGGSPIRFLPIDFNGASRQILGSGIEAELAGDTLTVTGEPDSAPGEVHYLLFGLDDETEHESLTSLDGSFSVSVKPARNARRFILAISARLRPDEPLEIQFNEALNSSFSGIEILADGRRIQPKKIPVSGNAAVRIQLEAGWKAKEKYILRLGSELQDPLGNTWDKVVDIDFEVLGSDPVDTYPLSAARGVARLGSLLFVAADADGLVVLDASDPAHLRNAMPDGSTFRFPLNDPVQAVTIDPHGRVIVAGGGVHGPGQLKIFDPLSMSFKGSTIVSDQLNAGGTQLPAGLPQRVTILSNDEISDWKLGDPAPAGLTLEPAAVPTDENGEPLDEYLLKIRGTGTPKLPVTFQDANLGRWARVDAAAATGAFEVSLRVRPGDRLRLLRNNSSIAYLMTRGVGVQVVDVNAFYNAPDSRVVSDVLGAYSGFGDPNLRLCGQTVADLSTAVNDLGTLFDPANLNPYTLVGLVASKGLVLLRSNPSSIGNVSFLTEECVEYDGSRAVAGMTVLQGYAFDLDGDGKAEDSEKRDYIAVSHQQAGVLIYDATDRENLDLVGRVKLPGGASRLAVDSATRRLYVSALANGFYVVDLDRAPTLQVIDEDGDGTDDRLLETVTLPGNTNSPVHVVPELGVAYASGLNRGLTSVVVKHPQVRALTRDPADGRERVSLRFAPLGAPTAPESSDPAAKNLPGTFRIVASLPGFTGNQVKIDVVSEDAAGGKAIRDAGDPEALQDLPRASWTGDDGVVLRRLAEHPWEPGYELFSSDEIAVLSDLRAASAYQRSDEEDESCVRCDQKEEKVKKGALQLLSGDSIRVSFPEELRDQLEPLYGDDRLDSASLRLSSVRWELSPTPQQEPEQNPSFSAAPGMLSHNAEMTLSAVDLAIRGRGMDFVFRRTYRNQTVGSGPFGPGWDHGYNQRLRELPNGDVEYFDGNARKQTFKKKQETGELEAPKGVFATLERVSSGWVMIDAHHNITRFDRFGRLVSIANAVKESKDTGSELTFHYGLGRQLLRVRDDLDRDIRFEYDEKDRIKKITDFDNREFSYEYDSAGRLVKVLTPPVETVLAADDVLTTQLERLETEYVYDQGTGALARALGARDNISAVKDAKDQSWLQVSYADPGAGKAPQRVQSMVWGGGSVGVQYDNATKRTTVTDARGKNFAYTHNDKGQVTQIKDPTDAEVQYTYDDEGLVTSRTEPLGRVTRYTYDQSCDGESTGKRRSKGNLTRVEVTAGVNGANGSADTLVTCTDYESQTNQPVRAVDSRGVVTQISRDRAGLPERVVVGAGTPDQSVTETAYNEYGQPTQVINPNGNVTWFQYSASEPSTGYLERITVNPNGLSLVTTFDTDSRGNVTRMIDPRGVSHTRSYNDLDWIVESRRAVTSAADGAPALGYVTTYFYDANGNLAEVRLPYGDDGSAFTRAQYAYGVRDELVASAFQVKPGDPGSLWIKEYNFYDENLNLIRRIEPEGQTTEFVYDDRNLLQAAVQGYNTPEAVTVGYGYDAEGRQIAFSDGRQKVWSTFYDGFGRVMETRDPLGNRSTVRYDDGGNPVETSAFQAGEQPEDPPFLLARRTAQYDALSRVRSLTEKLWTYSSSENGLPQGARDLVTTMAYDPASNLLRVTDPLGRVARMEYDKAERQVATVDAAGNRVESDLDATGNPRVTRSIEKLPDGGSVTVTIRSVYDALGRRISLKDELENEQTFVYDARNNLRFSIDAEKKVTERSYDGLGRLIRLVQPEGIAVDYGYDRSSRLVSYKDALGQETNYTYDVLNRQTAMLYPSQLTSRPGEHYAYDRNGNPVQITDPNGTIVTQAYDPANRLTGRTVAPASGIIGPTAESFVYDGLNRLTRAQSGNVVTELTFDSLTRLVRERNAGRELTFQHDDVGSLTRYELPSGFAVRQTFDVLSRPTAITPMNGTAPGDEIAAYTYRGADLVLGKTLANGLTGTRQYDAARRLLDETFTTATGRKVFQESLSWTPRSLKSAQSRGDLNGRGQIFAYDGAGRLLQAGKSPAPLTVANNTVASSSAFASLPDASSYAYDQAQNLLAKTEKENGVATTVDLPLDGSQRNRPGSIGSVPLEWDANGNLKRKGDLRFEYDFRNRLTRVTRDNVEVATYRYDAFNRRVGKTLGAETRDTVWRGWQPAEEYRDGDLDQRRIYGLGIDEIVQLQVDVDGDGDADQAYAPIYDETGNLVVMTGANGKPIERYEYTPYGQRKIFVDLTPPAVEQVRVKGNELWVELSEEVSGEVLAASAPALTNVASQQPIEIEEVTQPVLTGRQARRRLVISLAAAPPAAETQVRLKIPAAALQDSFLNQPAQDYELTFAWPAADAVLQDSDAIELQRVAVHNGILEIELSEEPDLATTSAILVDGAAIPLTVGEDRYTLKSASALPPGAHTVAIGTTLADLNGNTLAQAFSGALSATATGIAVAFVAPDPRETTASTIGNLFGFQGLQIDPETGLMYVRNRYYDPEMGRFISTDPLGYVDGPNTYGFAINDPVNGSDPLGLTDMLKRAEQALRTLAAATRVKGAQSSSGYSLIAHGVGAGLLDTSADVVWAFNWATNTVALTLPFEKTQQEANAEFEKAGKDMREAGLAIIRDPSRIAPDPTPVIVKGLKAATGDKQSQVELVSGATRLGAEAAAAAGAARVLRGAALADDAVVISDDLVASPNRTRPKNLVKPEPPKLLPKLSDTTVREVLENATNPGSGKASPVGRSLQSHSTRRGSWLEGLASGDAKQNTAVGRQLMEGLIKEGDVTTATHKEFGNVVKVRRSDGAGFWFKESGEFIGFLERYTPR